MGYNYKISLCRRALERLNTPSASHFVFANNMMLKTFSFPMSSRCFLMLSSISRKHDLSSSPRYMTGFRPTVSSCPGSSPHRHHTVPSLSTPCEFSHVKPFSRQVHRDDRWVGTPAPGPTVRVTKRRPSADWDGRSRGHCWAICLSAHVKQRPSLRDGKLQ